MNLTVNVTVILCAFRDRRGPDDERIEPVAFKYAEAQDGKTDTQRLAEIWQRFNVGHEPEFCGDSGPDRVAVAYRAERLRSLSVGDVVVIGGTAHKCEAVGWKAVPLAHANALISSAVRRLLYEGEEDEG